MADAMPEQAPPVRLPPIHERMLVFGLRDGQTWHVKDVPSGKACGCICPACGEPLIAVNQGVKKAAHFRHEAHSDCASGYETALHLAGKEALLRLRRVALPTFRKQLHAQACDGRIFTEEVVLDQVVTVMADRAWEEVWMDSFRPDVVFEAGGHRLLIEVKVTHAVDDEKLAKLVASDVSAIEIDLSHLEPEVLRDRETFEAYVISDLWNRRWLYSRKLQRQEDAAMARLKHRVEAYEPEGQRRLAADRAREKRERARAQVAQQKRSQQSHAEREAVRKRLAPFLHQLERSQDEQVIARREQKLALETPVPNLALYRESGIPNLFLRCRWHWVFNATFEQWQAHVLDLLFPGDSGRPRPIQARIITKALADKFGAPRFVWEIITTKSKVRGFTLLTPAEQEWLPSPTQAVQEYLEHLCSIGVAKRINDVYARGKSGVIFAKRKRGIGYQGVGGSVQDGHLQQVKAESKAYRAQQALEVKEEAALKEAEIQRLQAKPLPAMEPHVAERVLAIRASEHWVHADHGGLGKRCSNCFMVAPRESVVCPFCKARCGGLDVQIDAGRLAMAPHLLPTSPGVSASLNSVKMLDLTGLAPQLEKLKSN